MSNVVSSDGSLWAKEAGEIVDAAPPFAYQVKGRRLSVVSTSNGEEVASIAGPSEEVTSQSVFDPLGFTSDGRYLVYEQYRDSKWAKVRSTLSDLVNWRTTEAEMRPLEIRCLEVQSGRTRLVGLPVRDVVAGGDMLPGDRIRCGDEVWDVPGHKPWLTILLVPLVPLLIAYRLIERRRRRTSGTTAASVEPVA
ncbi:hypothetical protein NG895_03445 [Aeoliella sp. ICT_H6.2]|uniref:Uncharacterized protein n=2 Tax=Aeoliella straminimaris TaxID=2954799 RepID=A0A9X2F6Z7_9BACT|nr:hypothetical protein [Aeoliella straminimaris]